MSVRKGAKTKPGLRPSRLLCELCGYFFKGIVLKGLNRKGREDHEIDTDAKHAKDGTSLRSSRFLCELCGSFLEPDTPGSMVSIKERAMDENTLSHEVIGCALKVHSALGPGLLESAYEECLYYELVKAGLLVEKQKPMPLVYDSVKLECGYRVDLLVERKLVIEVKSVEALNDVHLAQVLTYLKLSESKLGLLINFNVALLKGGIRRVVNGL